MRDRRGPIRRAGRSGGTAVAALGLLLPAPAGGQGAAAAPLRGAVPAALYANNRLVGEDARLLTSGRALVPVRALLGALGARVEWDPRAGVFRAWSADGTGVRLRAGEAGAEALIRSQAPGQSPVVVEQVALEEAPFLADGTLYAPVRGLARAMRAELRWQPRVPAVLVYTDSAALAAGPPDPPEPALPPKLRVALVIGATGDFYGGQPVPLRLTLRNVGGVPVRLHFPGGRPVEFSILRDGVRVWSRFAGPQAAGATGQLVLPPGAARSFRVTWNQHAADGRRVSPGRFTARASVLAREAWKRVTIDEPFLVLAR